MPWLKHCVSLQMQVIRTIWLRILFSEPRVLSSSCLTLFRYSTTRPVPENVCDKRRCVVSRSVFFTARWPQRGRNEYFNTDLKIVCFLNVKGQYNESFVFIHYVYTASYCFTICTCTKNTASGTAYLSYIDCTHVTTVHSMSFMVLQEGQHVILRNQCNVTHKNLG